MNVEDLLYITVGANRMHVYVHCNEAYRLGHDPLQEQQILQFLSSKNITHGIDMKVVSAIVQQIDYKHFPLQIAAGTMPIHGENGYISYVFEQGTDQNKQQISSNFRDIMLMPTVQVNDSIAIETLPTKGMPGKDVFGNIVRSLPGKKKHMRTGKNVRFDAGTLTYYATVEGQVSMREQKIEVYNVFSVTETLSMKTGNIDFVGSVEIHGDVPTGYLVKAGGDIRVFGFVEAATLVAGGSIYISEGFAGMGKGKVTAAGDVYVSYVNQGSIHAGESIHVDNAILHSTCQAKDSITCKRGNIIGGSLTAGVSVRACDIGNRLQTHTTITIAQEVTTDEKEKQYDQQLSAVRTKIEQLTMIGNKLKESRSPNEEIQHTLQRLTSSLRQLKHEQEHIVQKIASMHLADGDQKQAHISIQHILYPNVQVAFGKYQTTIDKEQTHVQCRMETNELMIIPLST